MRRSTVTIQKKVLQLLVWNLFNLSQASLTFGGFHLVFRLLRNGYVQEGTQLTGQAWDSMKGLGDKMGTIYQGIRVSCRGFGTTCQQLSQSKASVHVFALKIR